MSHTSLYRDEISDVFSFVSSRRRHTRCYRDWSSDVCSSDLGEVLEQDGDRVKLRVEKTEAPRVAARLLSEHRVADLTIEEPPIEDVIERVFAQEAVDR